MKIENDIITFKSLPKHYEKEKTGTKNNTVRIISPTEKQEIESFCKENWPFPIFIHIINTKTGDEFYRQIRDISELEQPDNASTIFVFTWDSDEPVCCAKCGKPVTPYLQIEFSKDQYGMPVCAGCDEK